MGAADELSSYIVCHLFFGFHFLSIFFFFFVVSSSPPLPHSQF